MTYKDYLDCAMQYREQVEVLDRLIKESNLPKRFETAKERSDNERSKRMFYEMKRECLYNMLELEARGKEIKERGRIGR